MGTQVTEMRLRTGATEISSGQLTKARILILVFGAIVFA